MKASIFLFSIFLSLSAIAADPDSTWLDFWVGTWKAEWKNADGSTGTAENKISKILGEMVVEENFKQTGVPADQAFLGRSYSAFIKQKRVWKQTWVDNSGAYLDFISGEADGNPVFQRSFVGPKGNKVIQRMVFFNISDKSFDWKWENSLDEGKTWNLSWEIHYTKKS